MQTLTNVTMTMEVAGKTRTVSIDWEPLNVSVKEAMK